MIQFEFLTPANFQSTKKNTSSSQLDLDVAFMAVQWLCGKMKKTLIGDTVDVLVDRIGSGIGES